MMTINLYPDYGQGFPSVRTITLHVDADQSFAGHTGLTFKILMVQR